MYIYNYIHGIYIYTTKNDGFSFSGGEPLFSCRASRSFSLQDSAQLTVEFLSYLALAP